MGNKPSTSDIVTGEPLSEMEVEPEICMSTSYYDTLMKNSMTLEKVIQSYKIIADATDNFGKNEGTFPLDHDRHHDHHDHHHKHHDTPHKREEIEPESESDDDGLEGYQYPQVIPNDLLLKETGLPITSEITKSFQQAKNIRSPYDKHWLNIYNRHAKATDYDL